MSYPVFLLISCQLLASHLQMPAVYPQPAGDNAVYVASTSGFWRKWFPRKDKSPPGAPSRTRHTPKHHHPKVFFGFEDERFQMHDTLIVELVIDFNSNKMGYADCTSEQLGSIPDISSNLLKSLIIQESGGSPAAWAKDPAQVNVPGDWNPYKEHVGLKEPVRRNEGEPRINLKAAVKFLVRKGFGASAQPAKLRPEGYFDSWEIALHRYNGRSDKTHDGKPYKHVYAAKILRRASQPHIHESIEIKRWRKAQAYYKLSPFVIGQWLVSSNETEKREMLL